MPPDLSITSLATRFPWKRWISSRRPFQSSASKDAKIIFGLADPFDEVLGESGEPNDEIRITVVASGMQPQKAEAEQEKKILKEFKVEEVELPAILRKGPPRGF